jgi:hypothetical protein
MFWRNKKSKPTEAEAIAALKADVKAAIVAARESGIHPQIVANTLNGIAAEVLQPMVDAQMRRQFT